MSEPTPEKALADALNLAILETARLREATREAEATANRLRTEMGKMSEKATKLYDALSILTPNISEFDEYRREVEKANR